MTLLHILQYPDPRLRKAAKPVDLFDETLKEIVLNMYETMHQQHGVGLASTQVNIPLRLFTMDSSKKQDSPKVLINPIITHKEGQIEEEEGCLSLPGIFSKIKRAKIVTAKYFDENGKEHQETFEDLNSTIIQHELDHLDGILFIDHLSNLKKERLLKKLSKLQRETL